MKKKSKKPTSDKNNEKEISLPLSWIFGKYLINMLGPPKWEKEDITMEYDTNSWSRPQYSGLASKTKGKTRIVLIAPIIIPI